MTSGQGGVLTRLGDRVGLTQPWSQREDRETKRVNEKIWAPPELSSPEYPHHCCIPPADIMKKRERVGTGAKQDWAKSWLCLLLAV